MGSGSWTRSSWDTYSSTKVKGVSDAGLFTTKSLIDELNPKNVAVRESRDSDDNPNSNALIVGIDQTGSMGDLARIMIREGCNTLATEIYDRKPISDPHIMFMGIGDADMYEEAPLQVTQFEADIRIAEQLQKIYLEGRGGGNDVESYTFTWYFAAMHTSIDCFEKRGKKGYLFTVGDECVPKILKGSIIEKYLGYRPEVDQFTAEELYRMVFRTYNVYHLMVEQGSFMRSRPDQVKESWRNVIGQNAIPLADCTKMSEVIVSTIQANEGVDADKIISSWDGTTGVVVAKAIRDIAASRKSAGGLVTFD